MMSSKVLARTSGSLLAGCIIASVCLAVLGAFRYISPLFYIGSFCFMVYMAARDELKRP